MNISLNGISSAPVVDFNMYLTVSKFSSTF